MNTMDAVMQLDIWLAMEGKEGRNIYEMRWKMYECSWMRADGCIY